MLCEPSGDYRLEVKNNGKTHTVSWSDCGVTETDSDEARRMRALAADILKLFKAMNVVKRLRPSDIICM
jgi:hypothetical protein